MQVARRGIRAQAMLCVALPLIGLIAVVGGIC
jgi:hypothetical protein